VNTLYARDVLKTSRKTSPVAPIGRIAAIVSAPESEDLQAIHSSGRFAGRFPDPDILQDILEIGDILA
jgi:hypothetical protein